MTKKPTYEELERRVKEFEQDALERMRVERALKPNAEQIDLSNTELENPHLVDGKYSIKDLIDIESLRKILEKFSIATGFAAGFLEHPSQEILIATGWRDICTKFHRAFPESAIHCKDSSIYLTKQLKELQELNIKPCENGLVHGATPIVIKGKYIANLTVGQILFEAPNIERFKKQAKMYGYDLDAYLEALSEVPVVSEDQFENALSFLSELSVMIAKTGLNNLELKERTRELEEEITQHKLTEKALQESEEHFRKLAEGSFEAIALHDKGVIVEANNQYYEMFGYNPEELAGKDAISLTATPESIENIKTQISLGNFGPYEATGVKKDGTKFPMEIRIKLTSHNGHKVRMAVIRDLTEQKQAERVLKERTRELKIKKNSLEEVNTAMKVLLKKREEDKEELEDNVLINVKELMEPYFKKIKKTKLDDQQKTFLSIIESNLNEIVSPFTRKMSLEYLNLTPTEIQIANLIRHGSPSKKIAELMNVSPRTIDTHRKNIRRKIGLQGQRGNLRSHLLSLH
ncbi:MAG: PocR ligand-binding domain-containing protein [Desulfobacteraceae bacterium]|nr:PocR ligand-binding domain-containing protein [Desulfobacteraceae bacterium]